MVFVEFSILKVLTLLNIIFGLIILFIAINLIIRFDGRLKRALIFLTITLITLFTRSFLRLFDLIPLTYIEYVNLLMNFLMTLFIFLSLFSLGKMVNSIDNHYNPYMKKRR